MSHRNAKLTAVGRVGIVSQIEAGYSQAEVARRMSLSRATVNKWWRRYREEGLAGLQDRSSRPKRVAHALGEEIIEAICALRRELGAGPHRLAYELNMARSTVYGVLRRSGLSVLSHMERTTRTVIRYERERPGELVHLDVKKVGRIPDGGGKRFDPGFKETGAGRHRPGKRGFEYVHVAVDDHSALPTLRSLAMRRERRLPASSLACLWPSHRLGSESRESSPTTAGTIARQPSASSLTLRA